MNWVSASRAMKVGRRKVVQKGDCAEGEMKVW
jgi:hypothetical protein